MIKQEEDKKKAVENDQNYDGNAHDYEENEYENEGFESPVEQPIQFYEGGFSLAFSLKTSSFF